MTTSTVTIVRPDNRVVVDGAGMSVDCSSLSTYVKAIQWTGESGWIEFAYDGRGKFEPNQPITSFEPYAHFVDKWNDAKAAGEKAAADAQVKRAAEQEAKLAVRAKNADALANLKRRAK